MSSRPQRRDRGAWRTTRSAALSSALTMLLATLLVCFGYPAHATASQVAAIPMTSLSAAHKPADSEVMGMAAT
ncbi:hypothetical protein, partial [Streptomyces sp. MBT62]|uniref:hypothetical protein n=1 Tax=Streptomyces sp. MBT62 TaxID=2800410 RepID=UPI0019092D90